MLHNKTFTVVLTAFLLSSATLIAKPASSTQAPVEKVKKLSKQEQRLKDEQDHMSSYGIPIMAAYAILIDYDTGEVLLEKNADQLMTPSSMTKILSAYMVMKKIKAGAIKEDTEFTVSRNAFRVEGSTSFLNIDDRVKVIDLLKGLIIQSGNDAAVVLAEGVSGSELAFANELNQLAKELGAKNTHFINASGLPHDQHKTTARDLSVIGKHVIRDFPEYYPLWSMTEYAYAGARQMNRNPLLYKNIGCDGIKTGSSDAAGYGMVASCTRNGRRLILVINGLKNMQARADEGVSLMNWGFGIFDNYKVLSKDHKVDTIPVWYGDINYVDVVAPQDITLTLKRIDPNTIKHRVEFDKSVSGAHACGDIIGKVIVEAPGLTNPKEFPLVLGQEVKPAGFFKKISDNIVRLFGGRQYKTNTGVVNK